MKNIVLQILGFAVMILGIQGAIVLLANNNAGLLSWLKADISLLLGVYVIISLAGGYLLSWAQKRTNKRRR